MSKVKRIIVNADDFGLCESVNQAIVDCHRIGNVTSTTMMANMPGRENAYALAKANPDLAIGLHFCITEGKPLTKALSLVDENGDFLSRPNLIKKAINGSVVSKELVAEFIAQLEELQKNGIDISHVDSHQHSMMIPKIFDVLSPILKESKLAVRAVNPPSQNLGGILINTKKYLKQLVNRRQAKAVFKSRFHSNDELVSIHDLSTLPNECPYDDLIRSSSADVVEVMVHPYIDSPDLQLLYGRNYAAKKDFITKCVREYDWLSKKPLFEGYETITFKDLG